jgi:hypothetical protein
MQQIRTLADQTVRGEGESLAGEVWHGVMPGGEWQKGVIKGGMHTVAGLLNLFASGTDKQQQLTASLMNAVQRAGFGQQVDLSQPNPIAAHVKSAADWLNAHSQDENTWQHIGDFGESALELMTPDALASLGKVADVAKVGEVATKAEQLADAAKAAQVLDKFKRIKALVMIGARAVAKGGAEVGGQTYVKTGGDTGAAVHAGEMGAEAGGVGGTALGAVSEGAAALAAKLRAPAAPTVPPELLAKIDQALEEMGPKAAKEDTGKAVEAAIQKMQDAAKEHANSVYNPLKAPLGLPENATRAQIKQAALEAAQPKTSTIVDASGKPTVTPGDGGKALAQLRQADASNAAAKADVNSAIVKKITAKGAKPELVHRYIANASLDDIRNFLPKLDAQTQAAVARNVMDDVVSAGGDARNFNAARALKALRALDKDGPKTTLIFGHGTAQAMQSNLQAIADATKTPAQQARFTYGLKHLAMYIPAAVGFKMGYSMTGSALGGAAGATAAEAAAWATQKLVMKAVVENPKIAQNLLFAIESGARPEKYGPFIGAMIQQDATEQSKQGGQQ